MTCPFWWTNCWVTVAVTTRHLPIAQCCSRDMWGTTSNIHTTVATRQCHLLRAQIQPYILPILIRLQLKVLWHHAMAVAMVRSTEIQYMYKQSYWNFVAILQQFFTARKGIWNTSEHSLPSPLTTYDILASHRSCLPFLHQLSSQIIVQAFRSSVAYWFYTCMKREAFIFPIENFIVGLISHVVWPTGI